MTLVYEVRAMKQGSVPCMCQHVQRPWSKTSWTRQPHCFMCFGKVWAVPNLHAGSGAVCSRHCHVTVFRTSSGISRPAFVTPTTPGKSSADAHS